jgi:hypothetical protein
VTVPFDNAIAVGDDFLRAPYWILDPTAKTIQFTSNLDEANAAIAVGTGAAMVTVGFRLNGIYDSYVLACSNDSTCTAGETLLIALHGRVIGNAGSPASLLHTSPLAGYTQ